VITPAVNFGHDLEAMAAAINKKTRLIYLANPNNPTGTVFTKSELLSFMAKVPETVIVVLDEAYTEYLTADNMPDGLELVPQFGNLIVTRTFSKAWGLAGLRLGFAYASKQLTDLLNRVRQPFNVNIAALAAAEAVLEDAEYLAKSRQVNSDGLVQLATGLTKLGIEYIPSQGNFITIDLKQPAMPVYDALLREGVIVRPVGIYKLPNHLRVSVGLASENERFLTALEKVLG
jgi:histidinol-phosphate aminotransferase